MKIKLRREVDRPFKDKQLLRVIERLEEEIVHAWLVKMTMNGGYDLARYNKGDEVPEWLENSEFSSSSLRPVSDR